MKTIKQGLYVAGLAALALGFNSNVSEARKYRVKEDPSAYSLRENINVNGTSYRISTYTKEVPTHLAPFFRNWGRKIVIRDGHLEILVGRDNSPTGPVTVLGAYEPKSKSIETMAHKPTIRNLKILFERVKHEKKVVFK